MKAVKPDKFITIGGMIGGVNNYLGQGCGFSHLSAVWNCEATFGITNVWLRSDSDPHTYMAKKEAWTRGVHLVERRGSGGSMAAVCKEMGEDARAIELHQRALPGHPPNPTHSHPQVDWGGRQHTN